MSSIPGINIVIAGTYAGANIDESSYDSGIVEVFTGTKGLFNKP